MLAFGKLVNSCERELNDDLLLACPIRILIRRVALHPVVQHVFGLGDGVAPEGRTVDGEVADSCIASLPESERNRAPVTILR